MGSSSKKQKTTQVTNQTNYPAYSTPYFMNLTNVGNQQLSQGTTGLTTATKGYLTDLESGKYDTVESNPYLQQVGEAVSKSAQEAYDTAAAKTRSKFQSAGGLSSEKAFASTSELAKDTAEAIADRLASLYGEQYQNTQTLKTSAAKTALDADQQALQNALSIASILRGSSGTSSTAGTTKYNTGLLSSLF